MGRRVRTKKRAGPYLVDIVRHTKTPLLEVYLDLEFNINNCSETLGPEGIARCFVYDCDKVVVAGYLKNFKIVNPLDYSIIDDHWETLKIIPKKDRKQLERILKKNYKTIEFWD